MDELASVLNRLKELDEKKKANAKEVDQEQKRIMREENLPLKETAFAYNRARKNVGKDYIDEIFAALNKLLPIYLELTQDEQAEVKKTIVACGYIHHALPVYVTYAADQIKGPENINWLQNALMAVLIDDNKLQNGLAFQRPLEQLYTSAHEAGLNPDAHIEAILSISELKALRHIQTYAQSDKFKRHTVKKPGQDQLIEQLKTLFAIEMQTLITDLMDLSNKQDIWDNKYHKELSRLMHQKGKEYEEAQKLAADSMGPSYVDEMFGKLDVLCPAYIEMNAGQRSIVKKIVHTHNALPRVTTSYTGRAANKLKQQPDPDWLRYGLVAVAIEDGSIDFRDTLMTLGSIYKIAYNAGLEPDKYFKELGQQLRSNYLSTFTESAHYLKDVEPTLEPKRSTRS